MVAAIGLLERLHEAAERAPRGAVEAATRALSAAGERDHAARAAFLARGINALATLAAAIDEHTLADAAGAPSDALALVRVLEQPETLAALRQVDPLLPAQLRGLRAREQLLAAEGGTVSTAEAAALLGLTRQAIDKRRRAGKLLGLSLGRRGYVYPVWQFADGKVLTGLDAVLQELAEHDPWMQVLFLLNGNVWLDEARPLDELRRGRVGAVLEAARTYGHQLSA
jgi:hypothetical protein